MRAQVHRAARLRRARAQACGRRLPRGRASVRPGPEPPTVHRSHQCTVHHSSGCTVRAAGAASSCGTRRRCSRRRCSSARASPCTACCRARAPSSSCSPPPSTLASTTVRATRLHMMLDPPSHTRTRCPTASGPSPCSVHRSSHGIVRVWCACCRPQRRGGRQLRAGRELAAAGRDGAAVHVRRPPDAAH